MTYQELTKYRTAMLKGATVLTDEEALDVPALFPSWEVNHAYNTGDRFAYEDKLYKVLQPHTSQADWLPNATPSLYAEVAKGGQGDDPSNPIPYNNNMELFESKYYSQANVVYYCFRSTGQPVYHNLADLVGLYVEVWDGSNGEGWEEVSE